MIKRNMLAALMLLNASVLPVASIAETPKELPRLQTNQDYIEEAHKATSLNVDDSLSVFHYVLSNLKDRVKVYPTENYFYFSFVHNSVPYAGNLRLDAEDRDQGVIHFSYFVDSNAWTGMGSGVETKFDAKRGVAVTKKKDLIYSVSHRGKTVIFELNDLSGVKLPADIVRKDESLIGPMQDESGIRFFLVFNTKLNIFHYLLDETVKVPDNFKPLKETRNLTIGTRTGFVFYSDDHIKRKILVGVAANNVGVNNYLDGPFDQLPDNFIKGDALKDAIVAASPEMKGKIDRFGNSPDDRTRYLIAPYVVYNTPDEVQIVEQCAKKEALPVYYACFSFAE